MWEWYQQLNASRTGNGFGPNPITYTEIGSWSSLLHTSPTEFEIACIKTLDDCFLAHNATKLRKKPNGTGHRDP